MVFIYFEFFHTWLLALAKFAKSLFNMGICDLRNGNTYGRSGKFTDSCRACLNASVDNPPLWNGKEIEITVVFSLNTVKFSFSFFSLTTSDRINDRTRSPHSLLVSCPNWYRAPRNLRNLANSLDVSVSRIGVAACGVDAADDVCGGVVDPPFWMGDVLPFATARCNAKLVVYCAFGDMGDRGATARTLSGESGVRPTCRNGN